MKKEIDIDKIQGLAKTHKGNQRAKALVRNFKQMGAKKFFKTWAKGIEGISSIQIERANLIGIIPIIIGIIIGLAVTIKSKTWWLVLILGGSFIISLMQLLGYLQKYIRLYAQDKIMRVISQQVEVQDETSNS